MAMSATTREERLVALVRELYAALDECAQPATVNPRTDIWFAMTRGRDLLARIDEEVPGAGER